MKEAKIEVERLEEAENVGSGQGGEKRVLPGGAWIELRGLKSATRQTGSIS